MDKTRKAFQLINSVLVERTVEEVLPIVKENRDGILQVKANIEERLNKLVAEIREFSARYNSALLGCALPPGRGASHSPHATPPCPPLALPSPRAKARGGRGPQREGCKGKGR